MSVPTSTSYLKRTVSRSAALVAAVATLGIAAACSSDSVSAPKAQPLELNAAQLNIRDLAKGLGQILTPSVALSRDDALPHDIVVSALIGPKGGEIEVKEAGLTLTFPKDAITGSPIRITVTAVAGKSVAYEFEPHGTQFAKGVAFEQDLDHTSWDKLNLNGTLTGGYFQTLDQLNPLNGMALLNELFPVTVNDGTVTFDIFHFSGYMVSTGRSGESF